MTTIIYKSTRILINVVPITIIILISDKNVVITLEIKPLKEFISSSLVNESPTFFDLINCEGNEMNFSKNSFCNSN